MKAEKQGRNSSFIDSLFMSTSLPHLMCVGAGNFGAGILEHL
jgi:hypothetical protein